jgi:hypothetical protein
MAQFKAIDSNVEVIGASVLSVAEGMEGFREAAIRIFASHGIVDPKAGNWYSQQASLDAMKEIAEKMGSVTLRMIGEKVPKAALWPSDIDTVPKALAAMDVAYHRHHRGGEVGHFYFERIGERTGRMVCNNPYPCDLDMGIIEATVRKFAGDDAYPLVKHDSRQPCRKQGGESCTYLISW